MTLDIDTLLIINAVNPLFTATALPFIMGRQLSRAAASARAALIVQALAWAAIVLSGQWVGQWPDQFLSALSLAFTSASQWLMFQAFQGWLGPRRGERLLGFIAIITPLGYALTFHSYPMRVGWANGMLALQLLLVCQATLVPRGGLGGAWRWVAFGCLLTMAFFTATRGVLGAFFTELYPTFRAQTPINMLAMLAGNLTMGLGNIAILVAWREEAEAQLREQAVTDSMTGLLNRHGWDERSPALFEQARRHKTPLTLIMLDLDHFKQINDKQGHEAGDHVLRMVGKLLQTTQRRSDLIARIGGEEFALLLPHTTKRAALHMEQRLRLAIQEEGNQDASLKIGYSAGLATLQPEDLHISNLMARADAALYNAKRQGRGHLQQAD